MKNHDYYLDKLFNIAEDVQAVGRAKLAAAVVYRGKIVSVGVNRRKTHPMQAMYGRNKHSIWLHAEIDAVIQASKKLTDEELKKSTLYIARYKKINWGTFSTHHQGLAKPCPGCQKMIDNLGIKEVIYTIEDSPYYEVSTTGQRTT